MYTHSKGNKLAKYTYNSNNIPMKSNKFPKTKFPMRGQCKTSPSPESQSLHNAHLIDNNILYGKTSKAVGNLALKYCY